MIHQGIENTILWHFLVNVLYYNDKIFVLHVLLDFCKRKLFVLLVCFCIESHADHSQRILRLPECCFSTAVFAVSVRPIHRKTN